jgi:hydroxylamine reductase
LDAIKSGQLEHIFLVGGCDGSEGSRRYYKKVAQQMPETSAILTLGCAKFRLLGNDYGTLPGTEIPRLLDMGQCNDSYAAIQVAVALAEALGTKDGVNGLPLHMDISWFEQKAVAVLLTLLHLGVKNIRLGPSLPAFITPDALQILVDTFDLKPADLKNPEEDLKRMLSGK